MQLVLKAYFCLQSIIFCTTQIPKHYQLMEKPRAEVPLNVYTNAENQAGIERTPASPFSAICPIPKVAQKK